MPVRDQVIVILILLISRAIAMYTMNGLVFFFILLCAINHYQYGIAPVFPGHTTIWPVAGLSLASRHSCSLWPFFSSMNRPPSIRYTTIRFAPFGIGPVVCFNFRPVAQPWPWLFLF